MSSVEGSLQCTVCAAGTFAAVNGTRACLLCPLGTYAPTNESTACLQCPIGSECPREGVVAPELCAVATYADTEGQAQCTDCPPGQATQGGGSVSLLSCVSPIPNFTMGFVALGMVIFLFVAYMLNGGYHKLAFFRRYTLVIPLANTCKKLTAVVINKMKQRQKVPPKLHPLLRLLAIILCATIGLSVAVALYLVGCLYIASLNSFILYRGMKADFNLPPFIDQLKFSITAVSVNFSVDAEVLLVLMFPFILIADVVSSISISIDDVNVTCLGAQAPIEMLINCVIFGLVVIFILTGYQQLFTLTIHEFNRALVADYAKKGTVKNIFVILLIGIMMAINQINLFQVLLRFCMGLVSFSTFGEGAYGITHQTTPACDNVPNAPKADSILGYFTSAIALYASGPILYLLSEVIVPRGLKHVSKGDNDIFAVNTDDRDDNNEVPDSYPRMLTGTINDADSSLSSTTYANGSMQLMTKIFKGRNAELEEGGITVRRPTPATDKELVVDDNGSGDDSDDNNNNTVAITNMAMEVPIEGPYSRRTVLHAVGTALRRTGANSISLDLWLFNWGKKWVDFTERNFDETIHSQDLESGRVLRRQHQRKGGKKMTAKVSFAPTIEIDNNMTGAFIAPAVENNTMLVANSIRTFQQGLDKEKKGLTKVFKARYWLSRLVQSDRRERVQKQEIVKLWHKEQINSLHTFIDLCNLISAEKFVLLRAWIVWEWPRYAISFFVGYNWLVFHLFSAVGRHHWAAVGYKYILYTQACLGIWTEELVDAYDLPHMIELFVGDLDLTDPESSQIVLSLISGLISTRALLFQTISSLTIVSVVVASFAGSPLYVSGPFLTARLPKLINWNAYSMSANQELKWAVQTGVSLQEVQWLVWLGTVELFVNEARLPKFIFNALMLSFSFLILFLTQDLFLLLAILLWLILLFVTARCLVLVTFVGRWLCVRDSDFRYLNPILGTMFVMSVLITAYTASFAFLRRVATVAGDMFSRIVATAVGAAAGNQGEDDNDSLFSWPSMDIDTSIDINSDEERKLGDSGSLSTEYSSDYLPSIDGDPEEFWQTISQRRRTSRSLAAAAADANKDDDSLYSSDKLSSLGLDSDFESTTANGQQRAGDDQAKDSDSSSTVCSSDDMSSLDIGS